MTLWPFQGRGAIALCCSVVIAGIFVVSVYFLSTFVLNQTQQQGESVGVMWKLLEDKLQDKWNGQPTLGESVDPELWSDEEGRQWHLFFVFNLSRKTLGECADPVLHQRKEQLVSQRCWDLVPTEKRREIGSGDAFLKNSPNSITLVQYKDAATAGSASAVTVAVSSETKLTGLGSEARNPDGRGPAALLGKDKAVEARKRSLNQQKASEALGGGKAKLLENDEIQTAVVGYVTGIRWSGSAVGHMITLMTVFAGVMAAVSLVLFLWAWRGRERTLRLEQTSKDERLQLQRAAEEERALVVEAFRQNVFHDMGHVLGPILYRAEEIADSELRCEMMADIQLMRDILDTRGSFDYREITSEDFAIVDIAAVVCRIVEDIQRERADSTARYKGPKEVKLLCRPIGLSRALRNLVANAEKHGRGLTQIRVGEKMPGQVVIEVCDSGPGIPAAMRRKMFDPYTRGTPGVRGKDKGSGLGLWIVREIVNSHGGHVEICDTDDDSEPTVRMTLPQHPRQELT